MWPGDFQVVTTMGNAAFCHGSRAFHPPNLQYGRMRIGADGSFLRWRRTGIGRYLDGLLHALALQLEPEDQLSVYYNAFRSAPLFAPPVVERFIRMPRSTLWNQLRVPVALAADGCDVYLGGALVVPAVCPAPRVVVVHDCMSFRFPAAKSRGWAAYLRYWTRQSARRASTVVCSSGWAARECTEFLGIPPDKIRVVPAAVDPTFRTLSADELGSVRRGLASRFGLPDSYILQVGGYELHKGGDTSVRAVKILRRRGRDVGLVRCGIQGPLAGGAKSIDLGYVEDADLHRLYQCAAVVCVPSTHEGFGLPVLEAMASGVPVVAARASSLPEVGADAAVYAEPGDPESFAEAIDRILVDREYAQRRVRLGVARAAEFTWERTASGILETLRQVGGEHG